VDKDSKLSINEIEFGKTDAYNELQEYGSEFYMNSFLQYDKYKTDSFINGRNYFICGNKGTGKTAFLKYLECVYSKNYKNLVIPIRFKSDVNEDDRKQIRAVGNGNIREGIINESTIGNASSYVAAWQVYLIRQIDIKSNSENGEYKVFSRTVSYLKMHTLLEALYSENKERIIPRLSKGYAKIKASLLDGIDADLELDIEFNKETSKINFSKTARKILEFYEQLEYGDNSVYVLIDELELSLRSNKAYNRDIELVRDLIFAVDKLNHISKQRGYNICFIASIRSEVINNVLSHGYEINKCVEDYGVTVEWYQKGGDRGEHPLLKIIENKIHASEKSKGIEKTKDVWGVYFSERINDTDVKSYILSYSWYRPRDIIRLMRIVQDQWNGEDKINQEMFDRASQDYSEKMWNEVAEELVLCYQNENDIKAIKKYFTGIEVPFILGYLSKRAEELSEIYPYIKDFFERNQIVDFCEKMFEWGVIGNSGSRMIFKFLGDRDLDPTSDMILHRPLRNYFAVKSRGRNNKRISVKGGQA